MCWFHFYPRSPRGERPSDRTVDTSTGYISIHAPREGSDPEAAVKMQTMDLFLSTLPARGATAGPCSGPARPGYFYPRSPRGERPGHLKGGNERELISIHAPREGSDRRQGQRRQDGRISIHAPREGSDRFCPRSPLQGVTFLSTLPARGATAWCAGRRGSGGISIHAPREGSDLGRLVAGGIAAEISIHAPREGSDSSRTRCWPRRWISIHAPREGSDAGAAMASTRCTIFLSTLPARGATGRGCINNSRLL